VESFIGQAAAIAHRRLRRFRGHGAGGGGLRAGGDGCGCGGLPKWIPVALGLVTSAAVAAQLVLRDQQHGVVKHETAVQLQEALRDFRFGMDEATSAADLRRRFQDFRRRAEGIKKRHGAKALRIMKEKLPRVALPR
jgi:hypothetical protein